MPIVKSHFLGFQPTWVTRFTIQIEIWHDRGTDFLDYDKFHIDQPYYKSDIYSLKIATQQCCCKLAASLPSNQLVSTSLWSGSFSAAKLAVAMMQDAYRNGGRLKSQN